MYIDIVPNRNSPPAVLLREAWREGKKTRKRTVANLSGLPSAQIEAIRRVLKGQTLFSADDAFSVERSLPHGHVEAILAACRRLGLDQLIASRPSRRRRLVLAMIVQRLIDPGSKLACTRSWRNTTLGEELKVLDADADELYAALDWLLDRQQRIENKLAARHLHDAGMALYDVTSSYYEGRCCPLDGIYVVRTSEPAERLSREDVVRGYKLLAHVERGFRTLKGLDIRVRPIYHRVPDRVRAHIFLCMLTYYVEWHLRRAWAPLLFDDEHLPQDRATRDPVAPARPSPRARRKKAARQTADGLAVQSFSTLLAALGTRCRNTCRVAGSQTFECLTQPTPLQAAALKRIEMFPVRAQ